MIKKLLLLLALLTPLSSFANETQQLEVTNTANAFEATCDFQSRIEPNPSGPTRLLLPGGCGTHGSYSWVAFEVNQQGDITIAEEVQVEWFSSTALTLTTKNRACSEQKVVSCQIKINGN